VSFGATGGDRAAVDVRPFYFGQYSILGTTMGSARDFAGLLELIDSDRSVRPVVHSITPLDDAPAAHAEMERRKHFGKLVLAMR
jgi:NADPH:quinone reductase-like Zn-dependent oxidoreductase